MMWKGLLCRQNTWSISIPEIQIPGRSHKSRTTIVSPGQVTLQGKSIAWLVYMVLIPERKQGGAQGWAAMEHLSSFPIQGSPFPREHLLARVTDPNTLESTINHDGTISAA
jgi:hypothetical protein